MAQLLGRLTVRQVRAATAATDILKTENDDALTTESGVELSKE